MSRNFIFFLQSVSQNLKKCLVIGGLFGISFGSLWSIRPSVVELDKLGREFELSRQAKQFIFNKRKDLTPEQKSEIYSIQNAKNESIES